MEKIASGIAKLMSFTYFYRLDNKRIIDIEL